MPIRVADRIKTDSPDTLYRMVETGLSSSAAIVELSLRGLPLTRPKPKRAPKSRIHMHAKRKCGVTGGYVDRDTITHLGRPSQPGQALAPWQKNATGRG